MFKIPNKWNQSKLILKTREGNDNLVDNDELAILSDVEQIEETLIMFAKEILI